MGSIPISGLGAGPLVGTDNSECGWPRRLEAHDHHCYSAGHHIEGCTGRRHFYLTTTATQLYYVCETNRGTYEIPLQGQGVLLHPQG